MEYPKKLYKALALFVDKFELHNNQRAFSAMKEVSEYLISEYDLNYKDYDVVDKNAWVLYLQNMEIIFWYDGIMKFCIADYIIDNSDNKDVIIYKNNDNHIYTDFKDVSKTIYDRAKLISKVNVIKYV